MLKHQARLAPELLYDKKRGIVLRLYTMTAAKEVIVHPADLRARYEVKSSVADKKQLEFMLFCHGVRCCMCVLHRCRCAQCIDEFTGEQVRERKFGLGKRTVISLTAACAATAPGPCVDRGRHPPDSCAAQGERTRILRLKGVRD